MDNNRPARVLRDGYLKAAIWANHGEKGVYHTVTFARTYTDENGVVRDSNSFSGSDLLRIAELARESYKAIRELTAEARKTRKKQAEQGADTRQEELPVAHDRREPEQDDAQKTGMRVQYEHHAPGSP